MKTMGRTYMPMKGSRAFRAVAARSELYRHIRTYLDAQGFIEVDTPVLYPCPEVAPMEQFVAHDPASGQALFLRVCPTEHLKRLLVAGFTAVYELSRNFRPGNLSSNHLPEFTSLECTRVNATYTDMMVLTEDLIATVVVKMTGTTSMTWAGRTINFAPPLRRVRVCEAVYEHTGIDLDACPDVASLQAKIESTDLLVPMAGHYGTLLEGIIDAHVLPNLDEPTFLTEYPWLLGGPAVPVPERPQYKQRCEFFIGSFELANMSTHLNDPDALFDWHQIALADKAKLGIGSSDLDGYLMRDIRRGLPASAIVGIGLDRLLMLVTGSATIGDVVAFPLHLLDKGRDDGHVLRGGAVEHAIR